MELLLCSQHFRGPSAEIHYIRHHAMMLRLGLRAATSIPSPITSLTMTLRSVRISKVSHTVQYNSEPHLVFMHIVSIVSYQERSHQPDIILSVSPLLPFRSYCTGRPRDGGDGQEKGKGVTITMRATRKYCSSERDVSRDRTYYVVLITVIMHHLFLRLI